MKSKKGNCKLTFRKTEFLPKFRIMRYKLWIRKNISQNCKMKSYDYLFYIFILWRKQASIQKRACMLYVKYHHIWDTFKCGSQMNFWKSDQLKADHLRKGLKCKHYSVWFDLVSMQEICLFHFNCLDMLGNSGYSLIKVL